MGLVSSDMGGEGKVDGAKRLTGVERVDLGAGCKNVSGGVGKSRTGPEVIGFEDVSIRSGGEGRLVGNFGMGLIGLGEVTFVSWAEGVAGRIGTCGGA